MKPEMQKYAIAFYQQQLRRDKETMFRAKPGSKSHTAAVVKYDRLRVDLDCTMVQLGIIKRRRGRSLTSDKNNTLPFVYKPL